MGEACRCGERKLADGAAYLIYFLGVIGFPRALASGLIARLEIVRTGNGFVHDYVIGTLKVFGPSVLGGS